jgi:hypothetical protein
VSLIDLATAKAHLRLESDYPDSQVQGKLDAAEITAAQFINRRVFATASALSAAIVAVPAGLTAAGTAYEAALAVADALEDAGARCAARDQACAVYKQAQALARETYAGISKEDVERWPLFEAGALLILGHLFENRQDVVTGITVAELPNGSGRVLQPLRVGLGV